MNNREMIGVIATVIIAFITACKYFADRKAERKIKEFENYHKMIKDLVEGDEIKYDKHIELKYDFENLDEVNDYLDAYKGKNKENKEKNEIYTSFLDRQIAIVAELRNCLRYYGISLRILEGLQNSWKNGDKRLLAEMELTKCYIRQQKTDNILCAIGRSIKNFWKHNKCNNRE